MTTEGARALGSAAGAAAQDGMDFGDSGPATATIQVCIMANPYPHPAASSH